MRWKWISSALVVGLLVMAVGGVAAQSPSVEWDSWNAQITAYNDRSQVDVAATQMINVLSGQLQAGQRDYSQPVDIQSVYFAMNGEQPQELAPGDGPGRYQTYETDGGVILEYQLPTPAQAGDTFVVQINYATQTATPGLIDWYVVPGAHGAPVNSSTVTINFPDGEAPDPSFVRLLETQGSVNDRMVDPALVTEVRTTNAPYTCNTYFVVLSDWTLGNVTLVATLILREPVFDGQAIFPDGNYVYQYDVQAQ